MFVCQSITEDLSSKEQELCSLGDIVTRLCDGTDETDSSVTGIVSSVKQQLSDVKNMALESINLLDTVQQHLYQLQKHEQWTSEKLAELKAIESLPCDQLSKILTELQVTIIF